MFLCSVSSPLVDMSCIYVSSPGFQLLVFFIFSGTYWNGIVYGYIMMFLNCNKMFFSLKKMEQKFESIFICVCIIFLYT